MNISPKVYVPLVIAILAAIVLYLLTGDKTYLVTILLSLAAGGAGTRVGPAPGVTQADLADVTQGKAEIVRHE